MAPPQTDQFNSGVLSPFWTFVEPDPNSDFVLTGSALEMTVPGGATHDFWTNNLGAARMEQLVDDVDFDLVAKLDDLPGGASLGGFHGVGLYVMSSDSTEANSSWIRWDVIANDAQNELFCASRIGGAAATTRLRQDVGATVPLYLRLERSGATWTIYSSSDGAVWIQEAQFSFTLIVARAGLFVSNAGGGTTTAHTCNIDYFENLDEAGGNMDPIELGDGSLYDRIMVGLVSQGFVTGSISDRERARLLAKLAISDTDPGWSLYDLYREANEEPRII